MSLTVQARIGKKYAIYLPKAVVKPLNLAEGEKVLLTVVNGTLTLESIQDPIQLALSGKKFVSVTPKQIETMSLEQQTCTAKSSP